MVWFLGFLAGLPLIAYVITFVLAVLAVAFSAIVLGFVQVTVTKLLFLGAGMYILLKFTLPSLVEGTLDSKSIVFLVILSILLIAMGVPGVILSTIATI